MDLCAKFEAIFLIRLEKNFHRERHFRPNRASTRQLFDFMKNYIKNMSRTFVTSRITLTL